MSTILNATIASGLQVSSDNSGVIQFQQNGSNTVTIPSGTGTAAVQGVSTNIVSGTAVASTSGTFIDFTSIPSWVKRITVMFNGVSTSGTSNIQIQIGSGSITITGYNSTASSGSAAVNATSGFLLTQSVTAPTTQTGLITLATLGSNIWIEQGNLAFNNASTGNISAGNISLSGILDRVRITTVNGTDTFDAGSINILYE
jgi:hypothetical protein